MINRLRVGFDLLSTLADQESQIDKFKILHEDANSPGAVDGFFYKMPSVELAVKCFKKLQALDTVDVYVLSEPSHKHPLSYTELRLWTELWLGIETVPNLILIRDKSLLLLDVIIDENIEGIGLEDFMGALFHVERLNTNWDDLYDTIKVMADEHILENSYEGSLH